MKQPLRARQSQIPYPSTPVKQAWRSRPAPADIRCPHAAQVGGAAASFIPKFGPIKSIGIWKISDSYGDDAWLGGSCATRDYDMP